MIEDDCLDSVLSSDTIGRLLSKDKKVVPCFLQIIEVKELKNKRTRVVLSDGSASIQALLNSSLTVDWIDSGKLKNNSIIQLTDYVINIVKSIRVLVVVALKFYEDSSEIIGKPRPIDELGASSDAHNTTALTAAVRVTSPNRPVIASSIPAGTIVNASTSGSASASASGFVSSQFTSSMLPPVSEYKLPSVFSSIVSLNPYNRNWTIKARVTHLSPIHHFHGKKSGRFAFVDLLDEHGGEIRATMYTNEISKFYNRFQEQKVYAIGRAHVKFANERFQPNNKEYEITLQPHSEVIQIEGEANIAKNVLKPVSFDSISKISAVESKHLFFDIIGIIRSINPPIPFTSKTGHSMQKQVLELTDKSLRSSNFTLWESHIGSIGPRLRVGSVLAAKACSINDYNGSRSITAGYSSHVFAEDDIEHADRKILREWYDAGGKNSVIQSITLAQASFYHKRVYIQDLPLLAQESDGRAEWATLRALITYINRTGSSPYYMGCSNIVTRDYAGKQKKAKCFRKCIEDSEDVWTCPSCNLTTVEPVYVFTILCTDHSGSFFFNVHGEVGEKIFGVKASEMLKMAKKDLDRVYQKALFKSATFRLCVKDNREKEQSKSHKFYHASQDVRSTVNAVMAIDFVTECKNLLDEINSANTIPKADMRTVF